MAGYIVKGDNIFQTVKAHAALKNGDIVTVNWAASGGPATAAIGAATKTSAIPYFVKVEMSKAPELSNDDVNYACASGDLVDVKLLKEGDVMCISVSSAIYAAAAVGDSFGPTDGTSVEETSSGKQVWVCVRKHMWAGQYCLDLVREQ